MTAVRPSLRRRLLFRLWGPLLALMFAGALLSFASARYFADLVYDQWLYDSVMTLATQIKGDGDEPTLVLPASAIEMLEWDRVDRVFFEVTTAHHGHIFGNATLPEPPSKQFDQPLSYDGQIGGQAVRLSAVTTAVPQSGTDSATVIVAETLAKRKAVVRSIMMVIVPIEAGLLLLVGLSIWIAVTSTLHNVDQLTAHLARIEPDRLKPLETIDSIPVEIFPLAEALNGLISRLAEARNASQRFVANAAHQIRTPLAALQLQTQRALRETDPARLQEALTAIERGMHRLTHLAQQLLTLARAEPADASAIEFQQIDLAALTRDAVEDWVDTAVAQGVDLGYEGETRDVTMRGDQQLLTELIGNLIDNAIRYGRSGGRVTVRLSGGPLVLSVEDDGPGIPAGERTRVLERFYRLPASAGSGSGLGLAIANEIAARHNARLQIQPGPSGVGTTVSVIFDAS